MGYEQLTSVERFEHNSDHWLSAITVFSELDDSALTRIASKTKRMTFNKNVILLNEGEQGEVAFLIESGSAKVIVTNCGDELVLYERRAGSIVGDISLLDDAPRSASVVTLERTVVHAITKHDFLSLLEDNPCFPLAIIKSLTQRLRHETDSVRSLAFESVYRRLSKKLIELAGDGQQLSRKYSHNELSAMIGSSREMVSKLLGDLVKGDYICFRDQRIVLLRKLPVDW